jgi:chorismate synthase
VTLKEEDKMPANSIGRVFTVTSFGESHGNAIGVVLDGVPPGITLHVSDIQKELDRRRPGQSKISTQRQEADRVEVLSGVFENLTTGSPIALFVRNSDTRSQDYESFKHLYRPGHADYTYEQKYGIRDWRGGGRASGRETVARVAAGAVAKKILMIEKITVTGFTIEIAGIKAEKMDYQNIEKNDVRTPDAGKAKQMVRAIDEARQGGDSVGGVVQAVVQGCTPGLGDPVFDKLDALLSHAVMSIGGVKGIEFGCGFSCSQMRGSMYNDPFYKEGERIRTKTNNCGGILGGVSTGEDIILRAAVRPPASISVSQDTVNIHGEESRIEVKGRHDPCIVPRVVPVIEAMVAITILDCLLFQKMYKGKNDRI